jgi:hypothetical protein
MDLDLKVCERQAMAEVSLASRDAVGSLEVLRRSFRAAATVADPQSLN